MNLRNRFLQSPRRLSTPEALRRDEIFGIQLKLKEVGVDAHTSDGSSESAPQGNRDGEFPSKRIKIRRSHSEENLYSWDALDYEEAKNKFNAFMKKEARAEIRERKGSDGNPDETNEFLDLLKEDTDTTEQNHSRTTTISEGSGTSNEEANEEAEAEFDLHKKYSVSILADSTKFEEGNKILIGQSKDGKEIILGGTEDELISNLVEKRFGKIIWDSSTDTLTTPAFVIDFFFTYRYFTKKNPLPAAQTLLKQLLSHYPPDNPSASPEQQALEGTTQLRVIGVIKHWVENHFYDFEEDSKLLENLLTFIYTVATKPSDRSLRNGVTKWALKLQVLVEEEITKMLIKGNTFPILYALKLQRKDMLFNMDSQSFNLLGTLLYYQFKKNRKTTGAELVDYLGKSLEIPKKENIAFLIVGLEKANQIKFSTGKGIEDKSSGIMIVERKAAKGKRGSASEKDSLAAPKPVVPKDLKNLSFIDIKPMEVARQLTIIDFSLYSKIHPKELSHQAWNKEKGKDFAPNVVEMIDRFNTTSYWVATEIVYEKNIRKRVSIVKRFIHIAEQCRKFNNFHTAMAILGGLNLGCVQRLKKTWDGVTKQYIQVFENLNEILASTGNYKNYRKLLGTVELPTLPYLAVFLRDLTFIEDGNKDLRTNGLVNFEKMSMLSSVFSYVQRFQTQVYNFVEIPEIRDFLLHVSVTKDDKELYKNSQDCEPSTGRFTIGNPSDAGSSIKEMHKQVEIANKKQKDYEMEQKSVGKSASESLLPEKKDSKEEEKPEKVASPVKKNPAKDRAPKSISVMETSHKKSIDKKETKEKITSSRRFDSENIFSDHHSKEEKIGETKTRRGSKDLDTTLKKVTSENSPIFRELQKDPSKLSEVKSPKNPGIKRSLKLVVIGDGMVGKTCLLVSYSHKAFPSTEYIPTVFDNYNAIENCDGQPINLALWDTAGQEDLARIRVLNYPGTDCFIICYAANNRPSLSNIREKWLPEIMNICPDSCFVIAGLKSDLLDDPKTSKEDLVTKEEGNKLSAKWGAMFHIQVSAMKGVNVQELFLETMRVSIQHKDALLNKKLKRKKQLFK